MRKEKKTQIIESIAAQLELTPDFYVTDIAGLNAEKTAQLRKLCYKEEIKLVVVKNTMLRKALESKEVEDVATLFSTLEGPTAIMYTTTPNGPAKLIKEFAKKNNKPVLKSALVQGCVYVGADQLENLVNIKSREELVGDIVGLLQSPAKNVISALQSSGGGTIAGLVKTLSEKE